MLMRNEGCDILVYPGAFNMTTGQFKTMVQVEDGAVRGYMIPF